MLSTIPQKVLHPGVASTPRAEVLGAQCHGNAAAPLWKNNILGWEADGEQQCEGEAQASFLRGANKLKPQERSARQHTRPCFPGDSGPSIHVCLCSYFLTRWQEKQLGQICLTSVLTRSQLVIKPQRIHFYSQGQIYCEQGAIASALALLQHLGERVKRKTLRWSHNNTWVKCCLFIYLVVLGRRLLR